MENLLQATIPMEASGRGVQSALPACDWCGGLTAWHTWHDPQITLSVPQILGGNAKRLFRYKRIIPVLGCRNLSSCHSWNTWSMRVSGISIL